MAMNEWVGLCRAAGYRVETMELMEMWILSGHILRDPILYFACLPEASGAIISSGTREHILSKLWTEEDRRHLRERIAHASGSVVQFPGAR